MERQRLIPYVDEQKVSIRVLYLGGYRSRYPVNSGIIVTAGWDFYPWSKVGSKVMLQKVKSLACSNRFFTILVLFHGRMKCGWMMKV